MRLQIVSIPPAFRATCAACGRTRFYGPDTLVADLDGEPWRAYYCKEPCASVIANRDGLTIGRAEARAEGR